MAGEWTLVRRRVSGHFFHQNLAPWVAEAFVKATGKKWARKKEREREKQASESARAVLSNDR